MDYKCPRCNYKTNIKDIFFKHIKRKNICKPINGNISLKDIHDKYVLHKCLICMKQFQSSYKLNKHLKEECTNSTIEKHNIMNDKTTQTDSSIIEDLQKQLNIKTNIINNIINLCNLENTMYNVGKPTTLKAWRNRNIGAIKDS